MKKKWLALFLCVSMTASLFGCQSKAPVESEQTVTEETPDAAETAEENETEESAEEGTVDLFVTGAEGADPRQAAFETAREKGFVLLLIKSEKLTLEEVFLKVTENAEIEETEENEETKTDEENSSANEKKSSETEENNVSETKEGK